MKFGTLSTRNLNGVHPKLVELMQKAIIDSPVDFTILSGIRTMAEQRALYAKGRTTPGDIVTMRDGITEKSNHQVKADGYGHAVDIAPYVNGHIDEDNKSDTLKEIAYHIKQTANVMGIKIIWGGDWTVKRDGIIDEPHFELR